MGVVGKAIPPGSAGKPTRTGTHRGETGLGADQITAPINTWNRDDFDGDWGKKKNPWKGLEWLICWCWWPQKVSGSVSWLPSAEQTLSPQSVEPLNIPYRLGHRDAQPSLEITGPAPTLEHPTALTGFPLPISLGIRFPCSRDFHPFQRGATWVLLFIHLSCTWK